MPISRRRRRRSHPGVVSTPPKRAGAPWRKRLGWPLVALGAATFLVGNIGARTGITLLPFDPHHVFAQFGGAVVAVVGLIWATGSEE
jgi:hypothetical protein